MSRSAWQDLRLNPGDREQLWELFHENSKTSQYDYPPPDEEVLSMMALMWESLPFEGYPVVELPLERTPLDMPLGQAIESRVSARALTPVPVALADLATLLHSAYGITRLNLGTGYPRPFRSVPSGGALYPLELFCHTTLVEGIGSGLFHYDPTLNALHHLRERDATDKIARAIVQPELVAGASLVLFVTALFARTTFKYGDRGYRFALLEAGHVAQNVSLACTGLGLVSVVLGGFFDRRADELLKLDGVTHSTIYMIAVGGAGEEPAAS